MSFAKNVKIRSASNFLKVLLVFILACFIFVLMRSYWPEDHISCDTKLDEVKFSAPETSVDGKRFSYKLCSRDIEGEIVLTTESSSEVGDVIVNSLIFGLMSSFADSRAPYGGQITSVIGCSNRKYLKEHTIVFGERNTKIVLAVANDRQNFGICTEDQIKYVSALWAGYDKSKTRVVVVRLFKPIVFLEDIDPFQKNILRVFENAIEHVNKN